MPHIYKKKDINDVFWINLAIMLDLDPDDKETFKKIRKIEQQGGAPAPAINEDVIFYDIANVESEYEKNRQESYENKELVTRYNNELMCHIMVYGPNGYDITQEIKYKILLPQTQELFNKYYIYSSAFPTEPVSLNEVFGSEWIKRYDMDLQFKHAVERRLKYDYISGINIDILADNGMERKIILDKEEIK